MYEESGTPAAAAATWTDQDDEVEALLGLVQDLTEQNSQLTELVGLLQRQLALARLRAIVQTPCFP